MVERALDRLEAELDGGDYLVGDSFTVADLTAASLLGPIVMPPEWQYPLWSVEELPPQARAVHEWLRARPTFDWVLRTYRRHRGESAEIAV